MLSCGCCRHYNESHHHSRFSPTMNPTATPLPSSLDSTFAFVANLSQWSCHSNKSNRSRFSCADWKWLLSNPQTKDHLDRVQDLTWGDRIAFPFDLISNLIVIKTILVQFSISHFKSLSKVLSLLHSQYNRDLEESPLFQRVHYFGWDLILKSNPSTSQLSQHHR